MAISERDLDLEKARQELLQLLDEGYKAVEEGRVCTSEEVRKALAEQRKAFEQGNLHRPR